MLTVNDFIAKFDSYSDTELIDIEKNFDGYSDEAQKAFNVVVEKRGGIELIRGKISLIQSIDHEKHRIENEAASYFRKKNEVDFIKNAIKSDVLDRATIGQIVDNVYLKFAAEQKDTSISGKTIGLVFLGGFIASIVGGVVMGYFTHNGKVLYLLIAAVFFINYGIIAVISRKSLRNPAVLIASIISTSLSFYLAGWFYVFFGSE